MFFKTPFYIVHACLQHSIQNEAWLKKQNKTNKQTETTGGKSRRVSVSTKPAGLQREFQDNQGFTEKPCFKKQHKKKTENKIKSKAKQNTSPKSLNTNPKSKLPPTMCSHSLLLPHGNTPAGAHHGNLLVFRAQTTTAQCSAPRTPYYTPHLFVLPSVLH